MRKRAVAGAVALVVVAVLAYVLWPRSHGGADQTKSAAGGKSVGGATAGGPRAIDRTPAALGGVVIDESGAPVAGATVSVAQLTLSRGERQTPGEAPQPIALTTGADGRFRAEALVPGRYSVSAAARGFIPGTVSPIALAPGQDQSSVEVRLHRGGNTLSGTISDIGGGPVGGALVRATSVTEGNIFAFFRAPATTISDASGHYALTLAAGSYMLEVYHPDYVAGQRFTEIRTGDRTEDFALVPGGVIYGEVRSRATDEPLAGATVTYSTSSVAGSGGMTFNLQGLGLSAATTNDQGRFVLRGLSAGVVQVRAFGPGYASKEPTDVALGVAEEVQGVVVLVDRAYSITGRVVNADKPDSGIGGVLVGAFNFSGQVHVARESTTEDGQFEIHGVENGSYFVGAAGEGRVISALGTNVTVEDADVTDVVVELDAGATLSGRVDPPSAARLALQLKSEQIGLGNLTQAISAFAVRGRADDDGTFTLHGVPTGTFTLTASADDGSEGKLELTIGDADQSDLLIRMEARAYIAGTVTDPAGNPVEGVSVHAAPQSKKKGGFAFGGDFMRGRSTTDKTGAFRVVGLEPGGYDVTVSDDKGQLAWADGEKRKDPQEPIAVTLQGTTPRTGLHLVVEARDRTIEGTVVGPGGGPVADAWVIARLVRPGDENVAKVAAGDGKDDERGKRNRRRMNRWRPSEKPALTDDSGHFVIRELRDATYDLEAEGLKGSARGSVNGVTTGTTGVRISLEQLAGISGRVTYLGQPVTSFIITAEGPMHQRTSAADKEGRYHLAHLDPGTYQLSVIADKGRAGAEVEVEQGQTAQRDLQLIAYGSVRGVVLDARTGNPIKQISVAAFSDVGSDTESLAMKFLTGEGPRTDDQGAFRVGRLGAGKGTLIVFDGDVGGFEIVAQKEFELKAGEDLDLGEIRGVNATSVPEEQRGELGASFVHATWSERPRNGPDKADAEPPADVNPAVEQLWVASVEEGGPAAEAGLAVGDRVVSVAGIDVAMVGAEVVQRGLEPRRLKAGEAIPMVIDHNGRRNTVNVVPRPAAP